MKAQRVSYTVATTRLPVEAQGVEVATDDGIEIVFGLPTLNVVDRRLNTVSIQTPRGNRQVKGYLVRGLVNPTRDARVAFAALTR